MIIDKDGIKIAAVILAAGSGTRMQTAGRKQMIEIDGKTVLQHTVGVFESTSIINSIVVVTRYEDLEKTRNDLSGFGKISAVVAGGATRAESARIGFEAIASGSDFVAIHDAVRCAVTSDILQKQLSQDLLRIYLYYQ